MDEETQPKPVRPTLFLPQQLQTIPPQVQPPAVPAPSPVPIPGSPQPKDAASVFSHYADSTPNGPKQTKGTYSEGINLGSKPTSSHGFGLEKPWNHFNSSLSTVLTTPVNQGAVSDVSITPSISRELGGGFTSNIKVPMDSDHNFRPSFSGSLTYSKPLSNLKNAAKGKDAASVGVGFTDNPWSGETKESVSLGISRGSSKTAGGFEHSNMHGNSFSVSQQFPLLQKLFPDATGSGKLSWNGATGISAGVSAQIPLWNNHPKSKKLPAE